MSDEWIKVSQSVLKEVREFVLKIDLDLETEFYEEMKNIENARKLKRIANEKRIDTKGYRYCLEVKTVTWSIPTLKSKS